MLTKKICCKIENKKLMNNIIGTVAIKGIAMFLTLFTMPSYIKYFNNQQILGVWFSIVSLLNWILTFDMGIGNGLRNHLVPALVAKDNKKIKELISSAYLLLGFISLVLGLLGFFLLKAVNFNNLFNISDKIIDSNTLLLGIRIVFCGVILQFFLKIITSVFYAMQKTVIPNLLSLISAILILIFVNIYKSGDIESKFIALSYAQVITLCLPLFIATIITFRNLLSEAKPNLHYFNLEIGRKVIGLGGQFFIVQICLMITTSTNEMLISYLSNSYYVVEYQAYNRIFYMVVTIFSLLIQPMWSAFAEANASHNYVWMLNIYKRFKLLSVIGSFVCLFIAVIFRQIVNLWLGNGTITVNFSYSLLFAILISITLFINSSTSVANAMNELNCQIIWTVIGAIIKIPLSFVMVKYLDGWIGVVVANIIVLLPLMIFQSLISERSLKKKIQARKQLI